MEFKRILLLMTSLLSWAHISEIKLILVLINLIETIFEQLSNVLKKSVRQSENNRALKELGTNHVHQMMNSSSVLHLFAMKDRKIGESFLMLLSHFLVVVTFIDFGSYVKLVQNNKRH